MFPQPILQYGPITTPGKIILAPPSIAESILVSLQTILGKLYPLFF